MDDRKRKSWPQDLASELSYQQGEKPLHDYLRDNANLNPEKIAIIWYGREITYRELNDLSERFAIFLTVSGVKKGDHVALFLTNSPQYYIAHYGIQKIGAVVGPCSPLFKEWELEYQLKDMEAKVIVAADGLYDIVMKVQSKTQIELVILTSYGDFLPAEPTLNVPPEICRPKPFIPGVHDMISVVNDQESSISAVDLTLKDVSLMIYTSGTTGQPKGAMLSYENALFKTAAVVQSSKIGAEDVLLTVVPLCHIAGMLLGLNCPIYANASMVLLYRFDPVAVLQAIERYKCTWWYSVVPMNLAIMQVPNAGQYDISSLRTSRATSFGIILTQEIAQAWTKFTGGSEICEAAYGLSETHTADTFMPSTAIKWGTQGIPNYETCIRIIDPKTGEEMQPGEMGEIVLTNRGVFQGYWNKPEATTQTLRDGWVFTGDMGWLDEDGYLIFSGRFKEMIKVSGYSVFPEEVEAMLIRHEAISQVAVTGVPDAQKGEVVKAYVVLNPEQGAHITAQDIMDWAKQKITSYKSPRYVEFRESLPATGAGKVLRRFLSDGKPQKNSKGGDRIISDRYLKFWPKRLGQSLPVPKTSLYDNLAVSAQRYPDKAAIHYYGGSVSYRRFQDEVDSLAGFLQSSLGVNQNDRVLLFMQNSPQYVIAYYAILRANAVVVPMSPMNVTDELALYINDCEATVAIVGQELYERLVPLQKSTSLEHVIVAAYSDYASPEFDLEMPDEVVATRRDFENPQTIYWQEAICSALKPSSLTVSEHDMAVLPYTSGTTGKPKGCVHSHGSVNANTVGASAWTSMTANTITLTTLPLFHVTGMQHSMNAPIFAGGTIVLLTRWNRELAAAMVERYGCTHWVNIATMVGDFLANPNLINYNVKTLAFVGGGGAPLPEAVGEKLFQLLGVRYAEGYGLSETISQTHFNPPDRPKLQCIGIPSFDVDARIIDPDTLQELGIGEQGEMVVNGPQVMKGYWNRSEETEQAFITIVGKQFFRTGDIAKYDEDGYFFIVDRVKRMINASGFKVWPSEVESTMFKHPAIRQACVIGVTDDKRGETVKAFVILHEAQRDEVTEQDIIEWAKGTMSAYKYPRIVQFVESLPMSASGKVLWRQLQEEERERYLRA